MTVGEGNSKQFKLYQQRIRTIDTTTIDTPIDQSLTKEVVSGRITDACGTQERIDLKSEKKTRKKTTNTDWNLLIEEGGL